MTTMIPGQRAPTAPARDLARAQREVARVLVAATIGIAAAFAGTPWPFALEMAVLTWLATMLIVGVVPTPAVTPPGAGAAAAAALAEQRRSDSARILALELSVDRLRSVLDSLREGVVVVDAGGEVVLANPELRHALADPSASPVGRLLWDVVAPELAAAAHRVFAELDDERIGTDRPVRVLAIPYGKRIFDLTAVRVCSRESGQDHGRVFMFVDATRAHELAHLKDRFLSGISHELRTPLTNICAYAEILRHLTPGETSEWPEFVRIVHEESLQLNRLVDTVFDYAQLESGEAVFNIVACDPTEIVRSCCERVRERVAVRGIALTCDIVTRLPTVNIDAARFSHVLDHLLDNAIKFTPRDGRVRVAAVGDPSNLVVSVEDSGPGVPPHERESVFEKFHQLGDHLTDKAEGTGLGLATTRAVVARMGGTLRCKGSALGGASFVVTLPAAQPAVAPGSTDAGSGSGVGG